MVRGKGTVFLVVFGLAVFFAVLSMVPGSLAMSTAICRYDISGAVNYDYIFCPSDQLYVPLAVCGDGDTQQPNSDGFLEQCDDGDGDDTDICDNTCVLHCDGYFVADDFLYCFNFAGELWPIGFVDTTGSASTAPAAKENSILFQSAGNPEIGGLALDGSVSPQGTAQIFAITKSNKIFKINTLDASSIEVADVGGSIGLSTGFSFGPNNSFYWSDNQGTTGIDRLRAIILGPTPTVSEKAVTSLDITSIGFSNTQEMFVVSGTPATVYDLLKINLTDGSTEEVVANNMVSSITGFNTSSEAMDLGPNGKAVVVDADNQFWSIDPETGQATMSVHFSGIPQITGLALIGMCGDFVVDVYLGETCDDGNTRDNDGCDSTCTTGEISGQDILEVRISKVANKATGIPSEIFSQEDSMNVEVTVFNHSSIPLTGENLTFTITKAGISGVETALEVFNGSKQLAINPSSFVVETFSFDWDGQSNGSYQLQATTAAQAVEGSFSLNNTDTKFVTLGKNIGFDFGPLNVPETSPLLVVLTVFAVLSVIYFSEKKVK